VRFVNVELDASAPRTHERPILRRDESRRRAGGCTVEVASWRRPGRERIPLSPPDCERAVAGSALTVVTRAGRLGLEWVEAYRVDPAPGRSGRAP
jgi:hypothetical protein